MKRQKTNDLVVIMKYRLGQGFLRFLVRTTFLLDDLTDHDRDHSRLYDQIHHEKLGYGQRSES